MGFVRFTKLLCDYKDDGCDDGLCKRDFCVLAEEEAKVRAAAETAEAERLRPEAERIAREVLKRKGVRKPTEEQIRQVAQRADVLKEAKERPAVEARLFRDLIKSARLNWRH